MKAKDFARQYGVNQQALEKWITQSGVRYKSKMGGLDIEDGQDFAQIAETFKRFVANATDMAAQQEAARAKAAQEKQVALANLIVHSGFTFEGYTITKYSGYISGDSIVQVDRGSSGLFSSATNVGSSLTKQLVEIRRGAIAQLKEAAYDLGCNAVVGVDFDYIALEPETASSGGGTVYLPYVFAVTAHGSGVVIEPTHHNLRSHLTHTESPTASLPHVDELEVKPAGWYPYPDGSSTQRYWDGTNWTEHYA
jgi:uncharacterized protein YbjQ (UPF0145 family)/transposase-like protein